MTRHSFKRMLIAVRNKDVSIEATLETMMMIVEQNEEDARKEGKEMAFDCVIDSVYDLMIED